MSELSKEVEALEERFHKEVAISRAYEIQRAKMEDRIDELTKALAEVEVPYPAVGGSFKDRIETEDMTVVERLDRIERNMIFS